MVEHFRGHVLGEKPPNFVRIDFFGHRKHGQFIPERVDHFSAMLDVTLSCRLHTTVERRLFRGSSLGNLMGPSFSISERGTLPWNAAGSIVNPRMAEGFAEVLSSQPDPIGHCSERGTRAREQWTAKRT